MNHLRLAGVERRAGFREQALQLGCRSVRSVPLLPGDRALGALDIFAAETDRLPGDDVLLARRIAASQQRNIEVVDIAAQVLRRATS